MANRIDVPQGGPQPRSARERTQARVSDDGKTPPDEAHYTEPAPDPSASCGACVHFLGGSDGGPGACEIVAGPISPSGVSDFFEPGAGAGPPQIGNDLQMTPPGMPMMPPPTPMGR